VTFRSACPLPRFLADRSDARVHRPDRAYRCPYNYTSSAPRRSMDDSIRRALDKGHRIDITTIGRKTGTPRRIELVFHNLDGRIVISGIPFPGRTRGWIYNLEADPRATLLVEHWDHSDWSRLWWVRAELRWQRDSAASRAAALAARLAGRYPQYQDQPFARVLVLHMVGVVGWAANDR